MQHYVKRWRKEHWLPGEGYLELEWHPGKTWVEFGLARSWSAGTALTCDAWPSRSHGQACASAWSCRTGTQNAFAWGCALVRACGRGPLTLVLDNAICSGHRVFWDRVKIARVSELFMAH